MADKMKFDQLYERIKHHKTAMLTTVTAEGYIHSRPMMTQGREPGADVWFVSDLDTEKIAEIRAHPRVGVIYYRDADNAYVSLSGEARIETDKAAIRAKWKDAWKVWFPEGPDQTNLCLIKVDVHEAEYWEPRGSKLYVMFDMARAYVQGDRPHINPPVEQKLD